MCPIISEGVNNVNCIQNNLQLNCFTKTSIRKLSLSVLNYYRI